MEKSRYQLERLSLLLRTSIYLYSAGKLEEYRSNAAFNPIRDNRKFLEKLITLAKEQAVPLLYQDSSQVIYTCIRRKEEYLLSGPVSLEAFSEVELRRYYREYGLHSGAGRQIPAVPLSLVIAVAQMMAMEFTGTGYSEEDLIRVNHLDGTSRDRIEQEQILFEIREDEREQYHHTYQEERKLLECIKEGMTAEAVRYSEEMDIGMGRLGRKDMTHWINAAVVAVTLGARAAIEGGISPAEAYKLSDFYIQKTEECRKVSELLALRNRAVADLSERVRKKKEGQKHSNYIDKCKDYVSRHYKEKIYLQDMADSLGLSSTYLSRLFSRETGMRLQDYINLFRVERAANLLVYSEESISYIAEYVNFPSQSYFGKMFRKYKHMTPKDYRNRYKPSEFISDQGEA